MYKMPGFRKYRIASLGTTCFFVTMMASITEVFGMHVLILGGNGMMGTATVQRLKGHVDKITVMNRGNWYWDTESLVRSECEVVKCDRHKPLRDCQEFMNAYQQSDFLFDAVVDFSGFRPEFVKNVTDFLGHKIGRYIYISSDSTYEVCKKDHLGYSREEDAMRPSDATEREEYSRKDIYGNRKLEGEEVLEEQRQSGGVPFISLRLPDVIGPRDNTHRWWLYQIWIQMNNILDRPLSVPESMANRKLSFVYSEDVANLIQILLTADVSLFDQAYNLAFEENPTLLEFIDILKEQLQSFPETLVEHYSNPMMLWPSEPMQDQYDFPELSGEGGNFSWPEALYMFPSVTQGPIDIQKAKEKLNWKPTPFKMAAKNTVDFFEKAMNEDSFYTEKGQIIKTLSKRFSRDRKIFFGGLRKYYRHMALGQSHDEL